MPPKRKNKPGKNGYWQFVLSLKEREAGKGNTNMAEIEQKAAERWRLMSANERAPYQENALYERNNVTAGIKYTSEGRPVDDIIREQQEIATREQLMKSDINKTLKAAVFNDVLEDEVFLLTHINTLIYHPSGDKWYVCEIGIAAFNLRNGVMEVFHQYIKPGKLPLGFYGDANIHSKETHQMLELVQEEPFEDNTKVIFDRMIHFMKKYEKDGKMPALYAVDVTLEMTRKVIEYWTIDFNYQKELRVYNLQYMFYLLKNETAGREIWPTDTFSYAEIEKDAYSHSGGISCEFHDTIDNGYYCSKSIVQRYAFVICDNCCCDLYIEMIPGQHVPTKAKVPAMTSGFSSRCNSVSSKSTTSTFKPVYSNKELDDEIFEDAFPALGGGGRQSRASSNVSVPSFRSVNSQRSYAGASRPRTSEEISREFMQRSASSSMTREQIDECQRNFKKLSFPKHGASSRDKE